MKASGQRLDGIDLARGIAIFEMMTAHFAGYFPEPWPKLVSYTETAMGLFVLLAGFMVGVRLPAFRSYPITRSWALVARAGRILGLHYVIVLTAGLALYCVGEAGGGSGGVWTFLARSLLLANQVRLVHILPTFIPLFLLAPLVMVLLSRCLTWPLLTASACLFGLGQVDSGVAAYGEPAIFPFVIFQVYFVAGCVAGAMASERGMLDAATARRWLPWSAAILVATMAAVHLKVVPAGSVHTHPLNTWGLLYHGPIIATVILAALGLGPALRSTAIYRILNRFGRNSMLAFVLHLYFAVALIVVSHWIALGPIAAAILILTGIAATNCALVWYEGRLALRTRMGSMRVLVALVG